MLFSYFYWIESNRSIEIGEEYDQHDVQYRVNPHTGLPLGDKYFVTN